MKVITNQQRYYCLLTLISLTILPAIIVSNIAVYLLKISRNLYNYYRCHLWFNKMVETILQ